MLHWYKTNSSKSITTASLKQVHFYNQINIIKFLHMKAFCLKTENKLWLKQLTFTAWGMMSNGPPNKRNRGVMVHMQEGYLSCVALHYHDDLHTSHLKLVNSQLHIDKCKGECSSNPSKWDLKKSLHHAILFPRISMHFGHLKTCNQMLGFKFEDGRRGTNNLQYP